MERWLILGVITILVMLFIVIFADILMKRHRVSQARGRFDIVHRNSRPLPGARQPRNDIALAQQTYNDAVLEYNLTLRRFPGDIVGALLRLRALERIEAPDDTGLTDDSNVLLALRK
jgi:hypothetical protein